MSCKDDCLTIEKLFSRGQRHGIYPHFRLSICRSAFSGDPTNSDPPGLESVAATHSDTFTISLHQTPQCLCIFSLGSFNLSPTATFSDFLGLNKNP